MINMVITKCNQVLNRFGELDTVRTPNPSLTHLTTPSNRIILPFFLILNQNVLGLTHKKGAILEIDKQVVI